MRFAYMQINDFDERLRIPIQLEDVAQGGDHTLDHPATISSLSLVVIIPPKNVHSYSAVMIDAPKSRNENDLHTEVALITTPI